MCLNHVQEHKHLLIVSNKGREIKNHSLKSVNFIFLEWNSGISSFWPLNQSVMSVWSKHFRLSLNV